MAYPALTIFIFFYICDKHDFSSNHPRVRSYQGYIAVTADGCCETEGLPDHRARDRKLSQIQGSQT